MTHLSTIRAMPCILCEIGGTVQGTPTEAHHPRAGQGMSQKAADALAIPLCGACHRGPYGVHGDRHLLTRAKVTELDLVAIIVDRRLGSLGHVPRATPRKSKAPERAAYARPTKILANPWGAS